MLSVVLGCAAGALACAMLVINNLRDMATDCAVGKYTLAVAPLAIQLHRLP